MGGTVSREGWYGGRPSRGGGGVRVGGDDGELRPWHYVYVYVLRTLAVYVYVLPGRTTH